MATTGMKFLLGLGFGLLFYVFLQCIVDRILVHLAMEYYFTHDWMKLIYIFYPPPPKKNHHIYKERQLQVHVC